MRFSRDRDVLYLVKAKVAPPRPALGFIVQDGRVRAIGYGRADDLSRLVYTVSAIDCGT